MAAITCGFSLPILKAGTLRQARCEEMKAPAKVFR